MPWYTFGVPLLFDGSPYPADTVFAFEAVIKTSDPAHAAFARLWDVEAGRQVSGSAVASTSTTPERCRSIRIYPQSKVYRAEFGGASGAVWTCYAADIVGQK